MKFTKKTWKRVLSGDKTETRRGLKSHRGLKIGSVFPVQNGRGIVRGYARVKKVREQRLEDITLDECVREGFASLDEFERTWKRLYGRFDPNQTVKVIEFELMKIEEVK